MQKAHDTEDVAEEIMNDPLASPMLSRSRSVRDLASTTGLWQHAQEELTRPRRIASNSGTGANQAELVAQIAELREKVYEQDGMLRRIMTAVEGRSAETWPRSR